MEIIRTDSSKSPLLSEAVIERAYTSGLPNDPALHEPSRTVDPNEGVNRGGPELGKKPEFQEFDNLEDHTRGFQFDNLEPGASDVTGDESGEASKIPSASAKTFANVIGDMIQIYVPQLTYNHCKISEDNIRFHIAQGNMHPSFLDIIIKVNANTEEGMQISDEEIKMWKKAFKEFLEFQNITAANPTTAFIAASVILAVNAIIKMKQAKAQSEDIVKQGIQSYNPNFFVKPDINPESKQDESAKTAA